MVQRLHVWRCSSNLHKFFSGKLNTAEPDAHVQAYLSKVRYNVFTPRQALADCIKQLKTILKQDPVQEFKRMVEINEGKQKRPSGFPVLSDKLKSQAS
jgi:hypothetical protein